MDKNKALIWALVGIALFLGLYNIWQVNHIAVPTPGETYRLKCDLVDAVQKINEMEKVSMEFRANVNQLVNDLKAIEDPPESLIAVMKKYKIQ